jgi:hypothetical protein
VAQVLAVIEDPREKGILGDPSCDRRRKRAHSGDLADLSFTHVLPSPRCHLVAHQHHQLGTPAEPLARTRQQQRTGIGKMLFEGLARARF